MEFLLTLINGVSLGGIYAMIALGYTMVYGIAKMLNFAHGDIIMVGGYSIFVFAATSFGTLPPWVSLLFAVLMAVIICALLGFGVEKLAYKPLRGASPLAVLITAIGVSSFLQSLAQVFFGSAAKFVQFPDLGSLSLGELTVSYSTLITLISTVIVMLALTLFVKLTKTGRAMLAVSEDREAAQLMGVNINFIISITFIIGSSLAALAGLFSLMNVPFIKPTFGSLPGIKAFTAAVIGGIGSIPGAMLGGILLGVVECFSNSVPTLAPYTNAIEFAILIIILIVKPTGILGKKRREKV
ncbi:MAG: branched-chain amino acid ABC transporter permease [Clostridia bacterium]|nr:branched-chain amino acid ABC transporter permease [Clostridia bacterium]